MFGTVKIKYKGKYITVREGFGTGSKKGLHQVRRQIRTYTEDKPLLGIKGLFGKFVIPPFWRGNKKFGVIDSDYIVERNENPSE